MLRSYRMASSARLSASRFLLAIGVSLVLVVSAIGGVLLPLVAGWIVARSRAELNRTVSYAVGCSSVFVWLTFALPLIGATRPVEGQSAAYLCANFSCRAPVTTPEALRDELGR